MAGEAGRKATRGAGPLPAERVRFEFAREFSAAEFAKVKAAFPPDWDAKWASPIGSLGLLSSALGPACAFTVCGWSLYTEAPR